MDERVSLQLVDENGVSLLEELTRNPENMREFQWFGWLELRRWRRGWEENGLISCDGGTLMVAGGTELLGMVNWRRQPVSAAGHSWEIGILLLPSARGRGHGTQAQRLLARYLFAHTTAHRISAKTEVDNVAEQRALEKAGFSREGVSRATSWRDGAWRDDVVYSLLRSDPSA
jgi:RimJ/RimL family protein N-acetyltransferase